MSEPLTDIPEVKDYNPETGVGDPSTPLSAAWLNPWRLKVMARTQEAVDRSEAAAAEAEETASATTDTLVNTIVNNGSSATRGSLDGLYGRPKVVPLVYDSGTSTWPARPAWMRVGDVAMWLGNTATQPPGLLPPDIWGRLAVAPINVRRTAAFGPSTAGDQTAGVFSGVPSVTGNGATRFRISCSFQVLTGTVVGDVYDLYLLDSTTGTILKTQRCYVTAATGGGSFIGAPGQTLMTIDTPATGAHVYNVAYRRVAGTGTGTLSASATAPLDLVIEQL